MRVKCEILMELNDIQLKELKFLKVVTFFLDELDLKIILFSDHRQENNEIETVHV